MKKMNLDETYVDDHESCYVIGERYSVNKIVVTFQVRKHTKAFRL